MFGKYPKLSKGETVMKLPIQFQPVNRQATANSYALKGISPSDACCPDVADVPFECKGICIDLIFYKDCIGVCLPAG